jgi:hypothetical protein
MSEKFSALDPKKHGVGGIIRGKIREKEQDRAFEPCDELYAVVFFPRIENLGPAVIWSSTLKETLSHTPATAIAKFMDRGASPNDEFETWESYAEAGWKVRRLKIADLGDPEDTHP